MEKRKDNPVVDEEISSLHRSRSVGDNNQEGTLCDSGSELKRRGSYLGLEINEANLSMEGKPETDRKPGSAQLAKKTVRAYSLDPEMLRNLTSGQDNLAIATEELFQRRTTLDPEIILNLTKRDSKASERSLMKTKLELCRSEDFSHIESYERSLTETKPKLCRSEDISLNTSSRAPGAYAIEGPDVGSRITRRDRTSHDELSSGQLDGSSITSLRSSSREVDLVDVSAEVANDSDVFRMARNQIIDESTRAHVLSRKEWYRTPKCILIAVAMFGILIGGSIILGLQTGDKSGKDGEILVCSQTDFYNNFFHQCQCRGEIFIKGNETLYRDLANELEVQVDSSTMSSCSLRNQALWWLVNDTESAKTSSGFRDAKIRKRYALALLYLSTGGDDWNKREEWLTNMDECNWHGVDCTSFGDREISKLILTGNGMRGTIPSEISFLSSLLRLDLGSNAISGSIPYDLPIEMKLLRRLDVSHNLITGKLPHFSNDDLLEDEIMEFMLNNMTRKEAEKKARDVNHEQIQERNIFELIFSHNMITGNVPAEYGRLQRLRVLLLDHNQLNGQVIEGDVVDVGEAAAKFHRIESYSIRNNSMTGQLTSYLGSLTNLEVLDWSYTNYVGTIPTEIGNLIQLRELHLNHAKFTGTIPTEILNLGQLEVLGLASKGFTGTLPSEICDVFIYLESKILVDCSTFGEGCPCCECS